jgi:hypothetical protein
VIIGADALTDFGPALGRVYIGGDVRYAHFAAGHAFGATQGHPHGYYTHASIKGIFVGGDWIASSASAGVKAGSDHLFGTRDDLDVARNHPDQTIAHIGAVNVYGKAFGTPKGDDSFGIVAEEIGFVYINGQTLPFTEGAGSKDDFFYVRSESGFGRTYSDFTIHEVPLKDG